MTPRSSTRTVIIAAGAALASVLPLMAITIDDSWLVPAAVAVAAVAASGFLMRRLGIPAVVVPVAQLAVLVLWLGVLFAGDVALLGFIPTTAWATRLVDVFGEGLDAITSYVQPIPVPRGISLMLVGGAGLVALLVDVVAVGLRRIALTGFPLATCYAVAASVTPGGLAWWWFVPPAAAFLALLISEGRSRIMAWGRAASPSAAHSGIPETDSLARNGRRVSAVALTAAILVPGVVPVLSEGVLDSGRGGSGGGGQTIRTDNPIVDLQQNLQRPENVDVLTYTSSVDEPQYIRTVALDIFDGQEWKTSERPVPDSVNSGLPWPQGLDVADPSTVDYTIDVTDNYSSRWLPLPYPPRAIEIEGDWRYHAETLDVVSPEDDVRSMTYQVTGLNIAPSVEALRSAGKPGDELDPLLQLPGDLPGIVTDLAAEVTQDASNDFARAAALQSWFRSDGGFIYDIESQPGHSSTALADFLTDRRGYCEQFAASMAIMARALGIPARVAVGFTGGDYQGDATYLVRAHDSHAWPELYFDGIGWVRFEPTPPSRTGRAPDWTFIPADDAPTDTSISSASPTPRPSASQPGVTPDDDVAGGGGSSGDGPSSPWPLAVLGLVLMVAFVSTPWLHSKVVRAWRWRQTEGEAPDPAAAAEAAWAEFREAVRDAGLRWNAADTPRSSARRLADEADLDDDTRAALADIVTATERARYAPQAVAMPDLRSDAAVVRRGFARSMSLSTRVRAFLVPSRLRDAAAAASEAVADGYDWADASGERLRTALNRVLPGGARSRT